MYAAGRGVVRLLLVAAFVVTVVGVSTGFRKPRSKSTGVYRPNKDALKLLKHVMMHEKEWKDVLGERIKRLGEPPHKELKFVNLPVGPGSDAGSSADEYLYNVREIVATVTRHKVVIWSLVEYGAKALYRAMACSTFRYVQSQSGNIKIMLAKMAEPGTMLQLADAFKKSIVPYIDVLSIMPDNDDLSILLRAYWDSVKLLQYDGIKSLKDKSYPEQLRKSLEELIGNINNFLATYCTPSDKDYFKKIGIDKKIPVSQDPIIRWIVPKELTTSLTLKHAVYESRIAHSLGIITMNDHLWTSLFIYQGSPLLDNNLLDIDSPKTSEDVSSTSEVGSSLDGLD